MASNEAASRPLRILVTGAGGLIGRALCGALAGRGHAVAALLHRREPPNDDAANPTRPFSGRPGLVAPMQGDVAEPDLGLRPATAARLAADLDLVVHCAAVTGFKLADAVYRRINVGGTARVLAFAAAADPPLPLLHVGTAYVCGDAGGSVAEAPVAAARFNNGYEASKAEAEALVWAAHRAGRVVAVARPSIVVGRWADGETSAFGTVYQLIRLVAEGRVRVLPATSDASLDLVPLDHVVGGLVDVAERMAAANGRVVHLASGRPVPLAALAGVAAAFPGCRAPTLVPPERYEPAGLDERGRWMHEQVVTAYAAYLRPSPRFATDNLWHLSGRRCPPLDGAFLHRLIGFAVSAGYLPGARLSGCRDNGDATPAAARPPS